jgi:hypothetical protein
VTGLATAQERFGTLQGRVTDQQGAAVPGVTVTMTNVQTGAVRTFVTDNNGQYIAADLTPGRYNVKFDLTGFAPVERADVQVLLGRSFDVDAQMRVGGVTETGAGDRRSHAARRHTQHRWSHTNVTAEEIERIPKGRSFQSVAVSAPSVTQGEIEGGIQVNGASGSENQFTVDGVATNSLLHGESRQNAVFEYIQEVQVKTVGIPAEYGGALGGVIQRRDQEGGNVFPRRKATITTWEAG